MSGDKQPVRTLQCWDCPSEEFKLCTHDGGIVWAECVECGGEMSPANLYQPDENGKEHYDMVMNRD